MSMDAFDGPAQVAKIKGAIERISEGFRILAHGPTDHYLEGLVEKADALFKQSIWQVGRRVRLKKTPEINMNDSWGWMGAKHFLVEGAEGVIRHVDFHKGMFWVSVEWDNQTWINSTTKEVNPTERPAQFCHGEDWLVPIPPYGSRSPDESQIIIGTAGTTTDVEPELPEGVTYDSTKEVYVEYHGVGARCEYTDDYILKTAKLMTQLAKHVRWGMRGWDRIGQKKDRKPAADVSDAAVEMFTRVRAKLTEQNIGIGTCEETRRALAAAFSVMKEAP